MTITSIGAVFRLYRADHSLWLDELATAWVISAGRGEIPARSILNNLSPVYYTAVSWSTDALGLNEVGLRAWSLAAGIALIPMGYAAARRLTGSWFAGLVAAGLVAVDPVSLEFAQDARPYALVELFVMTAVLAFLRVQEKPTWPRRVGLIANAVLLFYLHYTTALFLLALLVCYLLRYLREEGALYRPGQALIDGVLVAITCVPAVAHLRYLMAHRAGLGQFIETPQKEGLLAIFPVLTILVLPGLAGAALEYAYGSRSEPVEEGAPVDDPRALLLCWYSVPIFAAWTLTRFNIVRIYNRRYVISAWPAGLLLAALVVARFRSRRARAAMITVAFGLIMVTEGPASRFAAVGLFTGHCQEAWREAIAFLNRNAGTDDLPLLVHSGLVEADRLVEDGDEILRSYCLAPVTTVYQVQGTRAIHALPYSKLDPPPREAVDSLVAKGGAWVIWRGSGKPVFLKALVPECRRSGVLLRLGESRTFPSVEVVRLSLAKAGETAAEKPYPR